MDKEKLKKDCLALQYATTLADVVYVALSTGRNDIYDVSHWIEEVDGDGREMANLVAGILQHLGIPATVKEEFVPEICAGYTEFTVEVKL